MKDWCVYVWLFEHVCLWRSFWASCWQLQVVGRIYSMADAAEGHNSVLSLCCTIWPHLFMDQDYTMWIGRLSKAAFGSKNVFTMFFFLHVLAVCVCWSVWVVVVSLVGHPHYQTCTGRHGWFPSTIGHVGSWKKSTIDSLWHLGASFHLLLPPVHASFHAAVLLNVFTMWCHMQFVFLPEI